VNNFDIANACRLNNLSEEEFISQISLNFLAIMDMKLEEHNDDPLTITRGNVSLLVFRPKDKGGAE
tara:strand:- start:17729 stop:17926 length:198 start_codon:yes stop_codon:yes gene_type:complete